MAELSESDEEKKNEENEENEKERCPVIFATTRFYFFPNCKEVDFGKYPILGTRKGSARRMKLDMCDGFQGESSPSKQKHFLVENSLIPSGGFLFRGLYFLNCKQKKKKKGGQACERCKKSFQDTSGSL